MKDCKVDADLLTDYYDFFTVDSFIVVFHTDGKYFFIVDTR